MNIKLDYVPGTEYEIYQNREKFSFGTDAILLSAFSNPSGRVLDMGSGTGIIPMRLADSKYVKEIVGVEIQSDIASLAMDSIALNKLESKVKILNMDLNNLYGEYSRFSFDTVITNPPYFEDGVMKNCDDNMRMSRHEDIDLCQWIKIASEMLKFKGKFYMVHRPNRLVDIFYSMRINGIEPKRLRYVRHNRQGRVKLVLIGGIKNGKSNLVVEDDLILYDGEERTAEFENMYYLK